MGIKKFKPTSPGLRHRSIPDFAEITRSKPEKSLLEPLRKKGGRNNKGRVTARHRGGGARRAYRLIDFKRDKHGIPARVASIEYDPNRSARIALLHYRDGEKRYILAPQGLAVDDIVEAGPGRDIDIKPGNSLPLGDLPLGTTVHNIEMRPGKGGQLARGAGTLAHIAAKEGKYAHIRLPSGEVRLIPVVCYATVGQVGNIDHANLSLGKAGASRWRGRRPHVRGVAQNPVDHPMGGGEGRSSGGRHPCSPWGQLSKGKKTRGKKQSDRYIVKRRGK